MPLSVQGNLLTAWEIPWPQIPISLANIHSDYRDDLETTLTFTLTSGRKLRLSFYENSRAILTVEDSLPVVRNISQFRKAFPIAIASIPTLEPLEEEENLLTDEYVERWRGSRLTHRMFRNIWYRQSDQFSDFKTLVEKTWPGMSI